MSLSAAASALAPNPEAERYSEQGHAHLQRGNAAAARDNFFRAVQLTEGKDKVYAFALGQSQLANNNISGAIEAFQVAHRAAPDWFAPKEALQMLGASINGKK